MGNRVEIEVTKFVSVDDQGNEAEPKWGFGVWGDGSHQYCTGFQSAAEVYTAVKTDVFNVLKGISYIEALWYSELIREQGGFWLNGDFVAVEGKEAA